MQKSCQYFTLIYLSLNNEHSGGTSISGIPAKLVDTDY
jgi:hypothetical protein